MKLTFTKNLTAAALLLCMAPELFAQGGVDGDLTIGETLTESWSFGQEGTRWYSLVLPASGHLSIETSLTGNISGTVHVHNANGGWINPVTAALPQTVHGSCFREGNYLIKVGLGGLEGASGTYSLTVIMDYPDISTDAEPNNSTDADLQILGLDQPFSGQLGYNNHIGDWDTNDYYKVAVPDDGHVTLNIDFPTDLPTTGTLFWYTEDGSYIGNGPAVPGANEFTAFCRSADTLITRIAAAGLGAGPCITYTASISLDIPPDPTDVEPNGSLTEATEILTLGGAVSGRLGHVDSSATTDVNDYYMVIMPEDGTMTIEIDGSEGFTPFTSLYNKNGGFMGNTFGTNGESISLNCIAADTLFVSFQNAGSCGSYTAQLVVEPADYENDAEPNDTWDTALPLLVENQGHLGYRDVDLGPGQDVADYYTFEVTEVPFNFELNLEAAPMAGIYLQLRTAQGNLVAAAQATANNDWTATMTYNVTTANTFYLWVSNGTGCGQYSLSTNVLSVQELNRDLINIYPNPFNEVLVIDAEGGPYEITLLDQTGRMIYRETILGQVSRNFDQLAKGLYHILVTDDATGAGASYKLVKM